MTDSQIKQSIKTNELILGNWEKLTHYFIVVTLLFIPLIELYLYLRDLLRGTPKSFDGEITMFIIAPTILVIIFYILQRHRLQFKVIETNLTREELGKIINQVSEELGWDIIKSNNRVIQAITSPSFFSGSWGEQITILFDKNRVLVNSICDPNNQSSIVSMGRNNRNVRRLINEIELASLN